ncbi:MAG: hypothetical protein WBA76_08715 [Phormidesmis sp.]
MVLTTVSLVVGCLTLSLSGALLYAAGLSSAGGGETAIQFVAVASVCSLGFAALSGWLTALVAQRAPMIHAIALALILALTLAIAGGPGELEGARSLLLLDGAIATTGIITGGWLRLRQIKARSSSIRS